MTQSKNDSDSKTLPGYRVVELTRAPVELYKILKFEGLVGSGGEAKAAVAAGLVTLNGVVETQKRKQIGAGDRIEFGDDKIQIKLAPTSRAPAAPAPATPVTGKAKNTSQKKAGVSKKPRPAIATRNPTKGNKVRKKPA